MASWSDILDDVETYQDSIGRLNTIRQEKLEKINSLTGRNVISYYSGWLKNPEAPNIHINDNDMNALMNAVYKLDHSKGLDIILHTPGGDIASTESIVNYLQSVFPNNIRAIIPQLSMSAGTMIALSCNSILMGKQSSLGPIDPQFGGIACQGILDEYQKAINEISANPNVLGLWQTIISKYHPTLIGDCENAVKWSKELASKWLQQVNGSIVMSNVEDLFISHANSYSHSRHISRDECKGVGLKIEDLESSQELQDAVLSLHHCYMILFDKWRYSKIIENHIGGHYLQTYAES